MTSRESLAGKIQNILALELSVDHDGDILGTGPASFKIADLLADPIFLTQNPTPQTIVGGSVEDFATRLFSLPGFMLRETYKGKPAVTVTFPTEQDADQFHLTLAELSMHRNKDDG